MSVVLVVDADDEVYHQHLPEWKRYGFDAPRVTTMQEAIIRLAGGGEYLFIAIKEDSIPNFIARLPILSDVAKHTVTPVFVFSSIITAERKSLILDNGADAYVPYSNCAKTNIQNAVALLKLHSKWANRPTKKLPILIGGDIVLSLPRRKVYVNDTEVVLTKKEFDILCFFISNPDLALSYRQIYRKIWGKGYDEAGHHLVWNHVHALRQKIEDAVGQEYIRNEKDYGYRFVAQNDK